MAKRGTSLLVASALGVTALAQVVDISAQAQAQVSASVPQATTVALMTELPIFSDLPPVSTGSSTTFDTSIRFSALNAIPPPISTAQSGLTTADDGPGPIPLTTVLTSVTSLQPTSNLAPVTNLESFPVIVDDSTTSLDDSSVTRYILPKTRSSISEDPVTTTMYLLPPVASTPDESSVTRYILPTGAASSDDSSVTRYILPTDFSSADVQSITDLESFPWFYPDSTTQSDVQTVTNLESFPWIYPDSSTSVPIVAETSFAIGPVPPPRTDIRTETVSQSEILVSTIPQVLPTPILASSRPVQTVTDPPKFSATVATNLSTVSEPPLSFTPVAIALSSGFGSALAVTGPTSTSTLYVAALTSIGAASSSVASRAPAPSPPSGGPFCQYDAPQCPLCDQATVSDRNGSLYKVYCDAFVLTSKNFMRTGNSSAADCVAACNEYPGCGAASISRSNRCLLGVGSDYYLSAQKGEIGYLKVQRASSLASAAASATSRPVASQVPNQLGCSLTDISCPRCNLVDITDLNGQSFRTICDSYLISAQSTNITTTDLNECLSDCNDGSCVGVTYDNGECRLARQRLIGSTATAGSLAFIPLSPRDQSSASPSLAVGAGAPLPNPSLVSVNPTLLVPSAFPTGPFTIETYRSETTQSSNVSNSMGTPLSARPLPATTPPLTLTTITDRVSLSSIAALPATLPVTLTTVTDKANLSSVGVQTATLPLTLTTVTDKASLSSTPASVATPIIACPAANGQQYALGDIRRPFTVFCDVAVYSQPYSIYPVDSLLECAQDCDTACTAWEYVEGICQLFDNFSDVIAVSDAIVGTVETFDAGLSGPLVPTVSASPAIAVR